MRKMIVPVENVEKAIQGARDLIENLRQIQKSQLVNKNANNDFVNSIDVLMDVSLELWAKEVEQRRNFNSVFNDIKRGILKKLATKHNHNVKLSEILGVTPTNTRVTLKYYGVKLKDLPRNNET